GRIYGSLFALLTTCKGLPSSYQRDLQEDKEPLFAAHDQIVPMLRIAAGALAGTHFREARLREAAQDPALVATEVADYLVAQGIPFREAHEIVGKLLRAADQDGKSIREMPLDRLRQFSPVFGAELSTVLTLESALAGVQSPAARLWEPFVPRSMILLPGSRSLRKIREGAFRMNAPLSASDIPSGFTFSATHCGLKRSRLDLGILVSDTPASAAAVFTTNQVVAAPVVLSRKHLRKSRKRMRGLIVNSGNANC